VQQITYVHIVYITWYETRCLLQWQVADNSIMLCYENA